MQRLGERCLKFRSGKPWTLSAFAVQVHFFKLEASGMIENPSLREEPRSQRAAVIPIQQESSILDWLENSGRLLARDNVETNYLDEQEEISELMGGDDASFDTDDDDDEMELDD
jgi:hypothetical protein